MHLTNEQIVTLKPLLCIIGAVVAFMLTMRYIYVKERNSWLGSLAAILVIFWNEVKDFIRERLGS